MANERVATIGSNHHARRIPWLMSNPGRWTPGIFILVSKIQGTKATVACFLLSLHVPRCTCKGRMQCTWVQEWWVLIIKHWWRWFGSVGYRTWHPVVAHCRRIFGNSTCYCTSRVHDILLIMIILLVFRIFFYTFLLFYKIPIRDLTKPFLKEHI